MPTSRVEAIDWYFDFISPFSYLQAEILAREPLPAAVRCKPVLFAGLLQHWGQLGPAEIDAKRRFTFRYCLWKAGTLGIPMKFPPAHPFNPLSLLRLAIAQGAQFDACLAIFRFVFREGQSADNPQAWAQLIESLGLPDAQARIGADQVKQTLRQNGEEALSRSVFGVPTLVVDRELFWGVDATDMCREYLSGAALFSSDEMVRLDRLPQAARRTVRANPSSN
jgi:2-hydroxychromene-2-carboxylate isomerase